MALAISAGRSIRRARSPRYGTSSANTAPVAGALKIAATPAAAPATRRTRRSAPRIGLRRARWQVPADRRARVQRRAFETHRPTGAQRRDGGHDPPGVRPPIKAVGRVVERVEVLVGRGRGDAAADEAARRRARRAARCQACTAISHSGRSSTFSNITSTTRRSNPATISPVVAPVIAASSSTWCERERSVRSSSRCAADRRRSRIFMSTRGSTPRQVARRPHRRRRAARRRQQFGSAAGCARRSRGSRRDERR